MAEAIKSIEELARNVARKAFQKHSNTFVYHNFKHTESVADSAKQLSKDFGLDERLTTLIQVAAWFHDIAYGDGQSASDGHEAAGAAKARVFMESQDQPENDIKVVEKLILVTKMDVKPSNLPEMILKDADCNHISRKKFEKHSDLLRMEWELAEGQVFTESEWLRNNIDFLTNQQFYTTIARNEWEKTKQGHLKRLKKQLALMEDIADANPPKDKNEEAKPRKYSRGVETMFRVTLRNHIQLSRIADNKANFLLSISAIILSLLLGNLITDNKPVQHMLMPSIYFLLVCIVTMVLAILAARPNITKGKFSREALLGKEVNILFFGNFHSMPLKEFNWGMDQLTQREDLLYHSLTTDLYFLGKVLHKKYQYLRTAFGVFMFGLITAAIFYLVMLIIQ